MTILFFGDIMGKIGRRAVKEVLPGLRKKYEPDLIMANVENLAHGTGVTEKTLQELVDAGVEFFTSGNHIYDKKEAIQLFEGKKFNLIRPANYPEGAPGNGYKIVEIGTKKVLVINLVGRVFFKENFDCPFRKADEILKETKNEAPQVIIVDFHAEATSERVALGHYLDGRVSAIIGTHTHIPTADAQILPGGTGYITDVGMVGAKDSVIGLDKKGIIKTFLTQIGEIHEMPEEGVVTVNAVLIETDPKSLKTKKIKQITEEIKI